MSYHDTPDRPLYDFLLGLYILGKRAVVLGALSLAVFVAVGLVGYLLDWGAWSLVVAGVTTWLLSMRY